MAFPHGKTSKAPPVPSAPPATPRCALRAVPPAARPARWKTKATGSRCPWDEARPGVCEVIFRSSWDFSWDFHRNIMGTSWEYHGIFMGFSWEYHGNTMGFQEWVSKFLGIFMEFWWELDRLLMEFEKGSTGFGCNWAGSLWDLPMRSNCDSWDVYYEMQVFPTRWCPVRSLSCFISPITMVYGRYTVSTVYLLGLKVISQLTSRGQHPVAKQNLGKANWNIQTCMGWFFANAL